jgi:hypothetical protein
VNLTSFYDIIDQQIKHNEGKSLFYLAENKTIFTVDQTVMDIIVNRHAELKQYYQNLINSNKLINVIETITNRVTQSFTKANQFIHIDLEHKSILNLIYHHLFQQLVDLTEVNENGVSLIFHQHYDQLKQFLIQSNQHDLFTKYYQNPKIPKIECRDYQANLQLDLLSMDWDQLMEPVLDIGCGKDAYLVHELRQRGIDAVGFDRHVEDKVKYLYQSDWHTFEFKEQTWGTIVSHMAFTNHFIHHHLRNDGQFINYARLYTFILKSLKPMGSFIYTPDLPFMETLVSANMPNYQVEKIYIKHEIYTTKITRLK